MPHCREHHADHANSLTRIAPETPLFQIANGAIYATNLKGLEHLYPTVHTPIGVRSLYAIEQSPPGAHVGACEYHVYRRTEGGGEKIHLHSHPSMQAALQAIHQMFFFRLTEHHPVFLCREHAEQALAGKRQMQVFG